MSLYTARGDSGMTDLSTGQRIAKNSWRVKAYGALDEFGSALGMARAFCENEKVKDLCLRLQKLNGLLMTDLASLNDYEPLITHDHVVYLEDMMDKMEEQMEPLHGFLIPGEAKGEAKAAPVAKTGKGTKAAKAEKPAKATKTAKTAKATKEAGI